MIDGASSLGRKFGVPQLIIGLTIVALGTSLPELVINVFASIKGNTELAIGNVIGSNMMNSLLIIGISATIYPISMAGNKSVREIWFSLFATIILFLLANCHFGSGIAGISRTDGIILLVLLGGFIFYSFAGGGALRDESSQTNTPEMKTIFAVGFIILGIAGLYFGGKWIVSGAGQIAEDLGMSQSLVGLTIVAFATSLPELATSIVAALKKNSDLAVGNAIGSNLFNILLVLGLSAVIRPIPFDGKLNTDLVFLAGATLLVIIFVKANIGKTRKAISSLEGLILIIIYIIFLIISLKMH